MTTADVSARGPYPVTVEALAPARFARARVLTRLLVLLALGMVHTWLGGLFGALYVLLPIAAAVLVAERGGPRFVAEDSRWLVPILEWVVGFYAYLLFATDHLPLGVEERVVRLRVRSGGTPTAGSALLRLVTSLPHLLVLALLGMAAAVLSLVAAVAILATRQWPASLQAFQRDLVAWMARLLVHHASLVEPYPPFSLSLSAHDAPLAEGPQGGGAPTHP